MLLTRRRGALTLVLAVAALLAPASARADAARACIDAATRGQTLRDQGKLLDALAAFVACAADACHAMARAASASWLAQTTARTPSGGLGARDSAGADPADVPLVAHGPPHAERPH